MQFVPAIILRQTGILPDINRLDAMINGVIVKMRKIQVKQRIVGRYIIKKAGRLWKIPL